MAVPNTTSFTFQNVIDTVDPTTDDLVDCFADAVASKFDPNYEGSKNQLLNFRNYGALKAFKTSANATSGKGVCFESISVARYHTGSGTYPAVGDYVWNTSSGTGALDNGWYKTRAPGRYLLTSNEVTGVGTCS